MLVFSYVFYYLGDMVSRLMDLISEDFPHVERPYSLLYPLYNRLMHWSSDLDKHEKLWKTV